MSTTAISKLAPFEFKLEPDAVDAATYTLKPLSGLEHMEVMASNEINEQGQIVYTGRSLRMAIKYGLKGWDGVCDADGEALGYSHANVERLPPLDLHRIANEILRRSEITGEERKNS